MTKLTPLPCPNCESQIFFYYIYDLKNRKSFEVFCPNRKCQENYFFNVALIFNKKSKARLVENAWKEWNEMHPNLEKLVCAEKI